MATAAEYLDLDVTGCILSRCRADKLANTIALMSDVTVGRVFIVSALVFFVFFNLYESLLNCNS